MKWPWRRREPDPVDDLPCADTAAAERALTRARRDRDASEANWAAVRWLSGALQNHREENHFAEMFSRAMQRKGE